ncbi:MAG: ABC transporter ATP-binding protein [Candidatus Rifleibacteriota bacterium]
MSAIIFNGVSKTYRAKSGPVKALDGFSLEVQNNCIYGLAGQNGAGKTTAIKILLGLLQPEEGEVFLAGIPAGKNEPLTIGFAPEIAELPSFLTVQEVLVYSCELLEFDLSSQKLDETLAMLGIADLKNQMTRNLSKGMRQRLSLAAALAHDPKIVILDEPTSGLDPLARRLVKNLLKQLKDQGKTLFFTTHILSDLQEVCDYIGIVHKGSMIYSGELKGFDAKQIGIENRFAQLIHQSEHKKGQQL